MIFIIFLLFSQVILEVTCNNAANDQSNEDDVNNVKVNVNDIAKSFISLLGVDETHPRIKELKEKLSKIAAYVPDNDKYAQLIRSESGGTDLNKTNFYMALKEDDHFRFLTNNDPKSLYLKLKEKLNRDDVLKIIAGRVNVKTIVKSARKVLKADGFGRLGDMEIINDVVDNIIAESPNDDHKFDVKKNESLYWDPQGELEDLKEYHRHDGRRIYKGERTSVRYYPFMVSIHQMGRFWCGGVIYWYDLVLTSAACLQLMHNNRFFRENPRVLQVRIGSNHSRLGGELVDALEVYFHPGYNPRTLRNNIAVIRLRRHLNFNYHRIPKVIEISHNPHGVPATAEVLLLGWGVTKMTQKMAYEPIFLNRKILPIYPNTFCKDVYGKKFVKETMFCAGTMTTGEGACDHDAGGPAIMGGKLVGIISFGPSVCGFPNAPTVLTQVGAFADWIETVNETMPSYYRGKVMTTLLTRKPIYYDLETFIPLKYTRTTSKRPEFLVTTTTTVTVPTAGDANATEPDVTYLRSKKLEDTDNESSWSF